MKELLTGVRKKVAKDPVLSICLLLAAVQGWMLAYPDPKLLIWPDSIGYLGPAVDAIERGFFSHWYGRGFLYPLFLLGLLSVSPDPLLIVYVQRALVFLTYLGLAASVWLLARHAARQRLASPKALAALSGLWLSIYVFYPPALFLAHAVMAETLFSLLLVLVLLALVLAALPETSVRLRNVAVITASAASVASTVVKPHGLLAAYVLPLLLLWLAPCRERRRTGAMIAVALLLSFMAFSLPEKWLQERYDLYTSKVFGPKTLFCNSADLIYDHFAQQEGDAFTATVRASLARILTPEARAAAMVSGWHSQGFDGDKCVYGDTAVIISKRFARDADAEKSYFIDTYIAAILQRPGYIFHRLSNQMVSLAQHPFDGVAATYSVAHHTVQESKLLRKLYGYWLENHKQDLIGFIDTPFEGWEKELKALFFLAGTFLVVAVLVFVLLLVINVVRGNPVGQVQRLALAMLVICAAINLLIGAVSTFDVSRFASMQAPLFVLLGLACSLAVAHMQTAIGHEIPQGAQE